MRGYGIFILWPCIFYYIRVFLFHDGGTIIGIYLLDLYMYHVNSIYLNQKCIAINKRK